MNEIILQLIDTYKMVLTEDGYRLVKEITITEQGKKLCRFKTSDIELSGYELVKYYLRHKWRAKYDL